ncbi:MAG: hypothetical protein ACYTEQ_12340 [Planctomycetota bacterium]|jgi:hypothetical protein
MSQTIVYAVRNGNVEHFGECNNSFRGAMWIWKELGEKYFPGKDMSPVSNSACRKIWALAKDTRLTDTEYYALLSTFDRAMVAQEYSDLVANALEAFEPGNENLKRQAELIRCAVREGAEAIAWNQTSVNCDAWKVQESESDRLFSSLHAREGMVITDELICAVMGEMFDESPNRPYNVNKDDKHWWILPRETVREDGLTP